MRIKLPDTLILLLAILAVFSVFTWLIPAGSYDRVLQDGREMVVNGSYHRVESAPASLWDFLLAPIRGFIDAGQIIAFIFFVAGSFGIINKTGAIEAGLQSVVSSTQQNRQLRFWVIPIIMSLFSLAGATFGMSEEVLVFVLITLPFSFALGYDSIVGISIPFIGAGAGFAGAFLNPFTVGIAQGIAEIPPFSGWEYRIVVWILFTVTAIIFVMRYARRIQNDPRKSPMFHIDRKSEHLDSIDLDMHSFGWRQRLVVYIVLAGILILVVGVNRWDWYINEISVLFLVMGVTAAAVSKLKLQEAVDSFISGASDMLKVAMVIAIAKGILIVATEGKIIDTILFSMAEAVSDYPRAVSVEFMFLMQSALNFFLPSGSGQAALTMPIMAPLSDILGVSRQTAVLAFQLGDGLTNLIIPTSGVTMGVLTIARIPYEKWFRWMFPLMLVFFALAMLVLLGPVVIFNWN